jgi:hypothetical protein
MKELNNETKPGVQKDGYAILNAAEKLGLGTDELSAFATLYIALVGDSEPFIVKMREWAKTLT